MSEHQPRSKVDQARPHQTQSEAAQPAPIPSPQPFLTDPSKLSPALILSLQRTYGNHFVQRLLAQAKAAPADPTTHTARSAVAPDQETSLTDQNVSEADADSASQPAADKEIAIPPSIEESEDESVIQRRIGFEFEWQAAKLYKLKEGKTLAGLNNYPDQLKYGTQSLPKADVFKDYGDYAFESDVPPPPGAAFIEFSTPKQKGFEFNKGGLDRLKNGLKGIAATISKVQGLRNNEKRFHLLNNFENGLQNADEVFVDTRGTDSTQMSEQATVGIRLDKLHHLYSQMADTKKQESKTFVEPDKDNNAFPNTAVIAVVGKVSSVIEKLKIPESAITVELKGLVELLASALWMGAGFYSGINYKQLFPLMHRTDAARLFSLLPPQSRDYFSMNKEQWVNLVLDTADIPDGEISDNPKAPIKVQRSEWLTEMIGKGTAKGYQLGRDLLYGHKTIAELLEKTDPVGDTKDEDDDVTQGSSDERYAEDQKQGAPTRSGIFEFRHNQQVGGVEEMVRRALDMFEYFQEIDAGEDAEYTPNVGRDVSGFMPDSQPPPDDQPTTQTADDTNADLQPVLQPLPRRRRKKGCFITTACVRARGLDDDCYELTVLRAFRDQYMLRLPGGEQLVETYYALAPSILKRIEEEEDPQMVFAGLYDDIRAAVRLIEGGQFHEAMRTYIQIVLALKAKYL